MPKHSTSPPPATLSTSDISVQHTLKETFRCAHHHRDIVDVPPATCADSDYQIYRCSGLRSWVNKATAGPSKGSLPRCRFAAFQICNAEQHSKLRSNRVKLDTGSVCVLRLWSCCQITGGQFVIRRTFTKQKCSLQERQLI